MTENRSLDDFFDAADERDGEADADRDASTSAEPKPESASDESPTEAEEGSQTEAEEEPPADEPLSEVAETEEETPDRPTTTYRWSPSGRVCPACGETTERQWRDGGEFVCADCKTW